MFITNDKLQKLVDMKLIDAYVLADSVCNQELTIIIGTEEIIIRATVTSRDGDLGLTIE
jgi:hypothetical protein